MSFSFFLYFSFLCYSVVIKKYIYIFFILFIFFHENFFYCFMFCVPGLTTQLTTNLFKTGPDS